MYATSGAHGRAAMQPSAVPNAGAALQTAGVGTRSQRFMTVIDRALQEDAALKAQDPSAGLPQDELTALQREADRLQPMCTRDASSIVLAEGLHLRVRNILATAAGQAGLTVLDHDVHDAAVCRSSSAPAIAAELTEALAKGGAATVARCLDGLKRLRLSPQEFGELAAARNPDGIPGLLLAAYYGHPTAVTAYMDGLKRAGLSPQQMGDLLAAMHSDGDSALLLALANGQAAVVTAYMDGLKGAGLRPQQIGELVAARGRDGRPGLYMALHNGQAAAITAFMSNLLQESDKVYRRLLDATPLPENISRLSAEYAIATDLDLNAGQIADIVAARDAEGTPGLHVAHKSGHAAAAQAYVAGLTALRHENRITPQLFEELAGGASLQVRRARCAVS